jgi:hypothetical protein
MGQVAEPGTPNITNWALHGAHANVTLTLRRHTGVILPEIEAMNGGGVHPTNLNYN